MPSIESLIAPGGLIREIGLAWKPPAGMGCNVLTTLLGMATAGKIPQEALDGSVALWPWRRLLGSEAWTESMVPVGQPWAHLYAMQRLVGGEITIQATTATPCPVLTPGRDHYIQRWLYGLEEGGHAYFVRHAPEGERPYYGSTPLRVVQSSHSKGYRDHGMNDWKIRGGSVFGVLTVPRSQAAPSL